MGHSAPVRHLVSRRSRATHPSTPMSSKRRKLTLNGVGPMRSRHRISTSLGFSMKVRPNGLAPFLKIGHSSKKRDSTTPTTSFARQLRIRDGERYANRRGTGILRQPRLPCREKGPGVWGVGRLQREVYQPIL